MPLWYNGDMRRQFPVKIIFALCSALGFGLLFFRWIVGGEVAGFFIFLLMLSLFMLRWRFPWLGFTTVIDAWICVIFYPLALVLPMFWAMYYRVYYAAAAFFFMLVVWDFTGGLYAALGGIAGLFLGLWEREYKKGLTVRDTEVGRFYDLQVLQRDLVSATAQIERMTLISERARIAREIHDNAGHEIVAAYISFQALRDNLVADNIEAAVLFDTALERLDKGAERIREAVHNLAPITALGVETLEKTCADFPVLPVAFTLFGDTNVVPMHIWNTLDACLNEALTNATRHARPRRVDVLLEVTPKLVRLCVENDGLDAYTPPRGMGAGLRNLRYRAAVIGGSLAIDAGDVFKLICVIPIKKEETQ